MRSNRRLGAPPVGAISGRTGVLFFLLAVLSVCVLAALVQIVATSFVEGETPDHAKAVNDARVSLIQLLGGVGLLGSFIYTVRTFGLTRATQRADRFTKAIGQLGDKDSESIRAGGVHSLRLLTMEDRRYWPVVEQILSALVRESAKDEHGVSVSVQAAVTALGERPEKPIAGQRTLDLRGVHLPAVHLVGANLERLWLDNSNLAGSDFSDARLANTTLIGANLENARLLNADFTAADLSRSNLRGADFYKAIMKDADLSGSDRDGVLNWATIRI